MSGDTCSIDPWLAEDPRGVVRIPEHVIANYRPLRFSCDASSSFSVITDARPVSQYEPIELCFLKFEESCACR